MADNSAILPSNTVFETYTKILERPVVKQEATRQGKIASLANSDGFSALCEVIDFYIDELKNIPVDPKTDSIESVGFRYLASKVTIEYLEDLKQMPQRYHKLQSKE